MMNDITLKQFLERASKVTRNYIIAWEGKWALDKQDKKIDEEVYEFKHPENSLNELEEAWDVFFSVITKLHLKDINNYAILESGLSTLKKIEERSQKAFQDYQRSIASERLGV